MFLPEDYTPPKTNSNYTKLQEGENRIRILSRPILGWEDWDNKKPLRFPFDRKPLKSVDPKKPIKHFWAFIVWNYEMEQIQIFSVTQATIRTNLKALCDDRDWGAPYFYDIKIIKKGEGTDTEYMVNPLPHKPVGKEVQMAFMEKRCCLEAFLECQDPFASGWPEYTPGVFSKNDVEPSSKIEKVSTISQEEAIELIDLISDCPQEFQTWVTNFLAQNKLPSLYDLTPALYVRMKDKANKELSAKKIKDDPFEGKNPFEGVA